MEAEVLIGSIRWTVAAASLALASRRLVPLLLPSRRLPPSELFLQTTLVAIAAIVLTTALCGAFGVLSGTSLLVASLALAALATWFSRRARQDGLTATRGRRHRYLGLAALPLALAVVVVALDTAVALPIPPTSWDAMTYHLYLPARWLQEGRIFHVPTVFADSHAAYAPQNGALFHAWNMALSGRDALTTASQGLAILFAAVALYRMALLLGATSQAAAWTAPLAVLPALIRRWGYSANVDVFMAAFFVGAVYWTLAAVLRRGSAAKNAVWAGALAAGLVAGTKTAGLVLAAGPLVFLTLVLLRQPEETHPGKTHWRRPTDVAFLALLATAGGGFWYVRNLLLYQNPLFPLDFRVGPFHFAGAFTSEAMGRSFLHVDLDRWLTTVDLTLGRPTWILAAAGVIFLLAAPRRQHRWPAAVLALGVAWWVWFCYAVLPYNNQTRFLIPALWLGLLGWPLLLTRLRHRAIRNVLGLTAMALFVVFAPADVAWIPRLERLEETGSNTRIAYLANTEYQIYAPGYVMFNDPALDSLRIAYTGCNMPYALMGPGWRHRVVYLNTHGAAGDGFYEHWLRAPRLYDTHKPGIYRGRDDDPEIWLRRLAEQQIDAVALFAPLPVELPGHWPLDDGFPIERRWIRHHPDLFQPVVKTPMVEIYQVIGIPAE